MKKGFILFLFLIFFLSGSNVFADSYIFYYGQGCSHCANVEEFFEKEDIKDSFTITEKEVYFDEKNREDFMKDSDKLGIPEDNRGVPILVILDDNNILKDYVNGDVPIIDYFKSIKNDSIENTVHTSTPTIDNAKNPSKTFLEHLSFFSVLLPAAVSDSINPCEFAVMLILLGAILTKYKSRRKILLAGLLFSLAIFLSYFAMGLGLYKALSNFSNVFYLKIVVGILGIIVGLANLKDYFWYGKWFVMEVPFAWRKNMKKIINSVTSPAGAFGIGIIVSLFLLPCTSGPYLVILGYLSSQNTHIDNWGYIYLFIYNIFFVLPMLLITFLVGFGKKSIEELDFFRDDNIERIHLGVGILMMMLGIYVILQAYSILP